MQNTGTYHKDNFQIMKFLEKVRHLARKRRGSWLRSRNALEGVLEIVFHCVALLADCDPTPLRELDPCAPERNSSTSEATTVYGT